MSLFRELSYDDADVDVIDSVQFCLLDPDDVKRRSVVHVTTTDTYVGCEPVLNGLYDPRMGVTDATRLCATCELRSTFCPGHFGHIELAKPVFFFQFIKYIPKILQCVCVRCGKLKYGLDTPEMQTILRKTPRNINRFNHVRKLCSKVSVCGQHNEEGCGARNPDKITRNSITHFVLEWKAQAGEGDAGAKRQTFGADEVFDLFRRITDAEVSALGLSPEHSRPEWMICTVLPVPPPAVRPCVHHETGQRQEDDLSYTLCHIIKNNNMLAARIAKNDKPEIIDQLVTCVQYYVATLMESQIQGIAPSMHKRSGRTLRSLADRLKGKEGRIRGNLMGKRVDFSARSVITPDPNISIDEVGVPQRIAMNLTFPEVVNEYNRAWLSKLVLNGPDVHPGAKIVRKINEGRRMILLKKLVDRSVVKLDDGDIVERHLIDGDYVLFNRQPSLHRMSMMGHRVRVMPFNTFRISTSVCTSFNADFDGDEMNMHVPQSYTTAVELEMLASVNTQIISPKHSAPIITIVQDTVLGVHRITQDGVRIHERDAFNIVSCLGGCIGGLSPLLRNPAVDGMYTGRQLLSCVVPPMISLVTKNSGNQRVSITHGEITEGVVDKKVYQRGTGGLVHAVYAECGPLATRDLFDNTQKLVCSYLAHTGFSVGVSDLIVGSDVRKEITGITRDAKTEVYDLIHTVHDGTFENKEIGSDGAYLETLINNRLNKATDLAGDAIAKMVGKKGGNRMLAMIESGSKGSKFNLTQMVGFLGQQNIEGKRVEEGFDERTLPHFTKFDDGPDARGFVRNSFLTGLSPTEFFFHAMGGRSGLIDTAIKSLTSDTKLALVDGGVPKYVSIGKWVDSLLASDAHRIKHYPEDRNMELLELETPVYIPTCDENGVTSWGLMTAVTRHDPGERVYRVKTYGGRDVTVAESESLLVWDAEKEEFLPKFTPDIKVSDKMPVMATLANPPVIVDFVDLEQYFPKTEYLHGTDYNTALEEVNNISSRQREQWWRDTNGTRFTLPCPTARQFVVGAAGRTLPIHNGCVYPYQGRASPYHIPTRFPLDFDNGVFIGLFLADGHADTRNGSIVITKEERSVQLFVERWFDKFNIHHLTVTDKKRRGFTTTVRGHCKLLARLLDSFVGKGARNKFVPDVAFAAPLEFVRGLLNGYFSGDGHIAPNGGIESSSVSHRLTEGIAGLCARLGIFGKMSVIQQKSNNIGTKDIAPANRLSIRGQFARRLASELDLVNEEKNRQLKATHFAESHAKFAEHNDVVMDKIVSIEMLPATEYPKLYDVTVPSTFNFTLANGLCVRDTADTGYLQRKLVKAMEDCKVYDDLTVRNSSGQIVQFMYGEDGADATSIEAQRMVYGEWTPLELAAEYALPDVAELADILDVSVVSADYEEICRDHFMSIVSDREFLLSKFIPRGNETPSSVKMMYPVPFERMLTMAYALKGGKREVSDLDPVYAIKAIEELADEFPIWLFGALCRMYLSPKRLIRHYGMNRVEFDGIIEQIRDRQRRSFAHAGEMVGVLSAQSIGEPATQMTLNSVHYDSMLLLRVDGEYAKTKIGDFVHGVIDEAPKDAIEDHPNDNRLAWIRSKHVEVLSCDEDGKVTWKQVEAVTRHPVINADGTATLLKVTLESGRDVTATKGESFLTRQNNKIVATNGSDLSVGDFLPVSKILPIEPTYTHLDMPKYLPKSEFIYMTEIAKAIEYRKTERIWFKKGQGKEFTIPYSRGDAMLDNFVNHKKAQKQEYRDGCVYPLHCARVSTHFPERIELDELFGFFCGAYLAEGCVTAHHVLISNVDDAYNARIREFCERFSVNYHVDDREINNGRSYTIRTHSLVLTTLITKMLGKLSDGKKIPAEFYAAPDEFLRGLIDGYFSGDGCIYPNCVTAGSASRGLLEDVRQILVRFGVQSKITSVKFTEKQLAKFKCVKPAWVLTITAKYARVFASSFSLTHPQKARKAADLLARPLHTNHWKKEYVPNVLLSSNKGATLDTAQVEAALSVCLDDADRAILQGIINADVKWDRIKTIEEVPNDHPFAYDLTVKDTKNFALVNGVHCRDTFHASGSSAGSKVLQGVPRVRELLSATRKIKSPSMTIVPAAHVRHDKMACNALTNKLQVLTLKDVVSRMSIYYEPGDGTVVPPEDADLMKKYADFAKLDPQECPEGTAPTNPWVLRIELDRDAMVARNVTMLELQDAITESQEYRVRCVYSDDGAATLVVRVSLTAPETSDALTELRALEAFFLDGLVIWGQRAISNTTMQEVLVNEYNPHTKMFESNKEWRIFTEGTDLRGVLGCIGVDNRLTATNDVVEIHEVLGIEAARQALLNEFSAVLASSSVEVNFRHMALLFDNMTCRGRIVSVDRFGINRGDSSAFSRASFEQVTDMIVNAGVFAELDNMQGVSANIMTGHIPKCGTGQSVVTVDMEAIAKRSKELGLVEEVVDTVDHDGTDVIFGARAMNIFNLFLPPAIPDVPMVALPEIRVV